MAIYESITPYSGRIVWKVAMTLLLTGPQQLVLIRDQNARGYNHNERFTSTVQASISLTLWCLGLILAVSTRGKYLKADQKKGRAHNSKTQFFLREDDRMTSASRNAANLVRELVIKAYQRFTKTCERTATETVDDLTIIAHTGCCQCGAVQFQFKAPRTLYVEEESSSSENDDDDTMKMMIQYPTTCIAVQSFVLKQGANRLKSFQRQHLSTAAYLFCCACGVHLMHALQPDSTDLFVNVRCLKRGTFVTRFADMSVTRKNYEQILRINNLSPGCSSPSNHLMRAWQSDSADLSVNVQLGTFVASLADENAAENNDGKFLKLKNSSASCTSPSDDFLGVPASPERVADDDDPLFTVTAASSLSKSLSDYWDDRSSTAELEFAAYRLRKALSPDTSKVAVSPQNDSDDEGSSKSAGSFAPLGPQNPINLQAPFAAAASGNPEVNNTASTMEIQTTKPKASKVKKRVKDNDKKPSSATASTGTSTSFQDSMAASLQSTEETRQLLRQFMSKHVASLNNPV